MARDEVAPAAAAREGATMHEPFGADTPQGVASAPVASVMMMATAATIFVGTVTLGGALGALGLVRRSWDRVLPQRTTVASTGSDERRFIAS
jgi:hypothetical protein